VHIIKIKQFVAIILISLIAFTQSPKAIITSDTYKQGIYNISEIKEFNAVAKLVTPNNITSLIINVTSLIIVDSSSNEKLYKRFDTVDEVITLGFIKDGDIIIIAGTGEISITFNN